MPCSEIYLIFYNGLNLQFQIYYSEHHFQLNGVLGVIGIKKKL